MQSTALSDKSTQAVSVWHRLHCRYNYVPFAVQGMLLRWSVEVVRGGDGMAPFLLPTRIADTPCCVCVVLAAT